jgi:hypothetical protein
VRKAFSAGRAAGILAVRTDVRPACRVSSRRAQIPDRGDQEATPPQRARHCARRQARRIAWAVLNKGRTFACANRGLSDRMRADIHDGPEHMYRPKKAG